MPVFGLLIALLGGLLGGLSGCANGAGDDTNSEQTCVGDGDCRSDHSCRNGVCQPNRTLGVRDAGAGEECLRPTDCASGFDCVNNVCTDARTDAGPDGRRDDLTGRDRRGGGDPGDDSTDDPGEDPGVGEDSGGPDEGTPDEGTPDEGTPDTGLECEGRDDRRYRDSCSRADQCCNGLCLGPAGGFGFCTQPCADYDSCNPVGLPGDEFFCLNTGGEGGYLCAPSDYGDTCETTSECLGQVCLAGRGTTGCSWFCSFGADCPSGSTCGSIAVSDGADGVTFIQACAPVGTDCAIDGGTGLNNCLSGTCLTPDTGGIGYCSVFCNDTDPDACPSGFVCSPIGDSDPVCVRPGDL